MGAGHIAEQCNFVLNAVLQGTLGTADEDIRTDTHSLQFLYAGLGRLRFHLSGGF